MAIKVYGGIVKYKDECPVSKHLDGINICYGVGGVFAPDGSNKAVLYGCKNEDEDKFYNAVLRIDQESDFPMYETVAEVKTDWENGDMPGMMTFLLSNVEMAVEIKE